MQSPTDIFLKRGLFLAKITKIVMTNLDTAVNLNIFLKISKTNKYNVNCPADVTRLCYNVTL